MCALPTSTGNAPGWVLDATPDKPAPGISAPTSRAGPTAKPPVACVGVVAISGCQGSRLMVPPRWLLPAWGGAGGAAAASALAAGTAWGAASWSSGCPRKTNRSETRYSILFSQLNWKGRPSNWPSVT